MENTENWEDWREKIIGFGDQSSRKSYYPELQRKIEELTVSENNLRTVFNSTNDAIIIHDLNGKIIEVNDKMLQMYHIKRDDILNYNIYDLSEKTGQINNLRSIWDNVLIGNDIIMEQIALRPKENTTFYAEVALKTIVWTGKEEILAVVRDITAAKKAEVERMRLQNLESLGILAGGIAHDFNNMLATILGRISLSIHILPNGEVKKHLSEAENSVRRATGLTRQLLTFAKGGQPEKTIINLQKIIKETSVFSLSGSNIAPEFHFNDTVTIEADGGQISQVIQNLVINAKQAMPLGGKILISTENYSDENSQLFVKLKIKDSGAGIPENILDKIFDPYFTTKETGTGLGLSVCHSIIRQHEGKIEVESETGKGTEFTILLPALKTDIHKDLENNEKANVLSNLNVLIMDDEPDLRDFLYDILVQMKHTVIISKEGKEAIELLRQSINNGKKIDMVILDLTIRNGIGGAETVKKIKEIDPGIKAIVMSGYADISIAKYKEYGFDSRLSKPFTINELNEIIFNTMKGK
jgi:two-component system, cell cycle sensor histidine kinase and response regulator CckA